VLTYVRSARVRRLPIALTLISVSTFCLVTSRSSQAQEPSASPAPPPPDTSSPPPPSSIEALRRELEAERHAREELEARVAARETRAAPAPLPVKVSGFVHLDWVMFRQSSQEEVSQDGQPLNEDRFVLRRARLRAERDQGLFHGVVELDANTLNGTQVRPVDAEATLKYPASRPFARTPWAYDPAGSVKSFETWGDRTPITKSAADFAESPWFMVTAGLFRTPFGFEVPEAERERPFLERSTWANALFPQSFDLGVRIVGGFRFVRYAFGAMNGDPLGERTFPGRDPNKSKDLVFRVGGAASIGEGIVIEGGFSGVSGRGFHRGNAATKDVIQWQDSNADGIVDSTTELQVIPGSPATPSSTFKRFALGADLRATIVLPVLGDLQVRGELVRSTNLDRGMFVSDPVVATRDLRQIGWYVGVSQELTRWALVGVRYDTYNPDSDASEQEPFALVPRDASMSAWSFNATARAWIVRLVAQYDHRQNKLGRDAAGRPASLDDDAFTLRAEARF